MTDICAIVSHLLFVPASEVYTQPGKYVPSVVSTYTFLQTHLHTYVRFELNLLRCQFIYPKTLIILRTALRASLNSKLIKLHLECTISSIFEINRYLLDDSKG